MSDATIARDRWPFRKNCLGCFNCARVNHRRPNGLMYCAQGVIKPFDVADDPTVPGCECWELHHPIPVADN
jgi:hypothetical protein